MIRSTNRSLLPKRPLRLLLALLTVTFCAGLRAEGVAGAITVGDRIVTYWSSSNGPYLAGFQFSSKGYVNHYALDCKKRQFLWTKNKRISTGEVTNSTKGAEWRSLNPKSTISNAVYEAICPQLLVGDTSAPELSFHTPHKGSPERKAIMDAVRAGYSNKKVLFRVHYLMVSGDWAWTRVTGTLDGKLAYESSSYVVQKIEGSWKVAGSLDHAGDCDEACFKQAYKELMSRYPAAPRGIFEDAPDQSNRDVDVASQSNEVKEKKGSGWTLKSEPDLAVEPGSEQDGFALNQDGSATFSGKTLFGAWEGGGNATDLRLVVYRSPDRRFAISALSDIDFGLMRIGVVDLERSRVVRSDIEAISRWGASREIAWSPNNEFSGVSFTSGEFEAKFGAIELKTGRLILHSPEKLPGRAWASPKLKTTRSITTEKIEIAFDVLRCPYKNCASPTEDGVVLERISLRPSAPPKTAPGSLVARDTPERVNGDLSVSQDVTPSNIVEVLLRDGQLDSDCVKNESSVDELVTIQSVDLNQDNVKEYLVEGNQSCACGAQKCYYWVYGLRDDKLTLLLSDVMADGIDVEQETSQGYRDLSVILSYKGTVGYTPYRFDGIAYVPDSKGSRNENIGIVTNTTPAKIVAVETESAKRTTIPVESGQTPAEFATTQIDRVELQDGSTLAGDISGEEVSFTASFGEIEIEVDNIRGFSGGKVHLVDGTVLNGKFAKGEIAVSTSVGKLNVSSKEIVSIERGKRNLGNEEGYSGANGNPAEQLIVKSVKSELVRKLAEAEQDTIFELVSIRKENGVIIPAQNAYVADIVINLKVKACGCFHEAERDGDLRKVFVFSKLRNCPAPPGKVVRARVKPAYSTATRSVYGINTIASVKGKAIFFEKEKGWSLERVEVTKKYR